MKYLVVAGCSHSVGTGLDGNGFERGLCKEGEADFRHKNRWAGLLSKKLNLKEINLGIDGGSNMEIHIKITQWMLKNKDLIKDCLFILSWTYPSRRHLTLDGDIFYESVIGMEKLETRRFYYLPNGMDLDLTYVNKYDIGKKLPNKSYLSSHEEYEYFLLPYICTLTSYIESNNGKYLGFHADDFGTDSRHKVMDKVYVETCSSHIWTDGHINLEGQSIWADILYDEIQNRELI